MSKKRYKYTQIMPILDRAGIKFNPKKLKGSKKDLSNGLHDLFILMCKKYSFDHKSKGNFKLSVYKEMCLKIIDQGYIDKYTFHKIASDYIICDKEDRQRRAMKKALGRDLLPEHSVVIGGLKGAKFYNSPEWRSLRYLALERHGNSCQACGRSPKNRIIIHVDHIKPRSLYPELALDINNLQILCEDCNLGKSNRFQKDWR